MVSSLRVRPAFASSGKQLSSFQHIGPCIAPSICPQPESKLDLRVVCVCVCVCVRACACVCVRARMIQMPMWEKKKAQRKKGLTFVHWRRAWSPPLVCTLRSIFPKMASSPPKKSFLPRWLDLTYSNRTGRTRRASGWAERKG